MLIKKFGSLLLALTLAVACIPGTMASAEEAAWFDIEVENGTYEGTLLTGTADDRTYMRTVQGTSSAQSTTSTFNVANEGTYDIWAVVGVKAANYLCSYKFTLGEETLYDQNMSVANTNAVGDALYTTVEVAANNELSAKWVKIASGKTISAGEKTLTAAITAETTYNQNKFGAIDVVRFVPSSWKWTPASNFDAPTDNRPTPDANGVIHLEAEDGVVTGYTTTEYANASGGKYLIVKGVNGEKTANTTLGFKLEESGKYDIYAAVATGSQDYLGGHKFTLDGTAIFESGMSGFDRSNDDLYGEQINIHSADAHLTTVRWVKIAEAKELEAGGHVIVNDLIKQGNMNGLIDCVRLIPTGMSWAASDFTTAPTAPDYYDLEAENGTLKVTNSNFTTTASTGDKYIFMNAGNQASMGMQGSTMSFYAKEDTYDIWALVGLDNYDSTGSRLCDYKFYWGDAETPFATVKSNNKAVSAWNPLYQTVFLNGGIANYAHWVQIANDIELSGSKVLVADIAACSNTNAQGTIDKIRVVPSSWNHTPTTTTAAPVAPEVTYDSFTLSDKTAGATATATVTGIKKTVEAEKNAVIIVAVYKDNKLVDVYPSAATALTTEGQTITTSVTLPSDITGVTVKAFLWDGLAAGMPYADDIEK